MKQSDACEANFLSTLLSNTPCFNSVDAETIAQLAHFASIRNFRKNEMISRRGDYFEHLCVLTEGKLELTITSKSGKRYVQNVLGVGQLYGAIAMFRQTPVVFEAQATEDSSALFIPRQNLIDCMSGSPSLTMALIDLLCRRSSHIFFSMAAKNILSPLACLANHLLTYASQYGRPQFDSADVPEIEFSQNDLADMLGLSRQSLNLEIGRLEKAGLITKKYAKIKIIDAAGLKKLVSDEL